MLESLPQDGIYSIISFLDARDTLSFALTATHYYLTITQIMQEVVPKLLQQTWTLHNALQSYHNFTITYKQLKLFMKYFNNGGSISDFTNRVKIDYNIGFALGDDMLLKMSKLYSIDFVNNVHTTEQNVPFPNYNELRNLNVPHVIPDIFKLIQMAPNLVRVNFSVKSVGVVEAIGTHCTKVKYLTIIGMDTSFATDISRVLQNNKLLYLDIDCTHVNGEFLHTIGDYAISLKELRLREVNFSMEVGGNVIRALETLHVSGNPKITPQAALRLVELLPNIRTLQGLDTTPVMIYLHESTIQDLTLHTAKNLLYNGQPTTNEKPYFHYIAKWNKLKRLDMHYHLFTLEELKSTYMPSVVTYEGDLIYQSEWLNAFNNAFPNVEAISLTNVVQQHRTPCFDNPWFLPNLTMLKNTHLAFAQSIYLYNRPNVKVINGSGSLSNV